MRLTTPYAINYLFDGNAHVYLPNAIGQLQDGSLFIAEAGMEQEKRRDRNQAKAEAARKVASREKPSLFCQPTDEGYEVTLPSEA